MPGRPGHGGDTASYREVERKFDVGESAVPPSFPDTAGVTRVDQLPTQHLDAVYFDTPGHDLAGKKITLRRRTGGTDDGWHLKLPAGPDARTEVRAPLGDADSIPAGLIDVMLAIVRDRPLTPVARITTVRDVARLRGADGTVLAEFCDDHVTASNLAAPDSIRWREWEIELAGSDAGLSDPHLLDRLSSRLRAAGAVPAGHGSKLARALGDPPPAAAPADPMHRAVADQVDALLVWDRAVRANADDAVHQMRVSLRKIRSLLRAGADDSGSAPILDELSWLAGLLGVARDAEVLGQRYQQALNRLPPQLVRGRVAERLIEGTTHGYRAGLRQALTAMRSVRYFRLLDDLDAMIAASVPGVPTPAPASIDAAYRRVRKAVKAARAADSTGRDKALHRIRKSAKRLRYTAAATDAPRIAERAKAIQTLLGDHQDSVVSREHLLRTADAAHEEGEDTFTYGLLYQQEDELARRCRAQLDTALTRLDEVMTFTAKHGTTRC